MMDDLVVREAAAALAGEVTSSGGGCGETLCCCCCRLTCMPSEDCITGVGMNGFTGEATTDERWSGTCSSEDKGLGTMKPLAGVIDVGGQTGGGGEQLLACGLEWLFST